MTDTFSCMFCKGPHTLKDCPHFADTKTYLGTFAPKILPTGAAKPAPSLAPTQFEQLFGRHAEGLLQDVLDHSDLYTHDEVSLAWQILGGTKKISDLDADDRDLLDSITQHLAYGVRRPEPVRQERAIPERHLEDDEGPPRDEDYETLVTKGQVDPSDG